MTPAEKRELSEMINEAIESRISGNRRFVDGVLEKTQEQNREYFLEKPDLNTLVKKSRSR